MYIYIHGLHVFVIFLVITTITDHGRSMEDVAKVYPLEICSGFVGPPSWNLVRIKRIEVWNSIEERARIIKFGPAGICLIST